MKLLSLFVESIRVANRLENMSPQAGLRHAEQFAADYCGHTPRQNPESVLSDEFELFDGSFMRPF